MCLEITKPHSPLVADKDIVCYKVLNYDMRRKDNTQVSDEMKLIKGEPAELSVVFSSLYYHMPVTLGYTYVNQEEMVFTESDSDYDDEEDKLYELDGGVYHSFEYLEDAITELAEQCSRGVVVKCIIPKGTTYWVGSYYGINGYGSRDIKYTTQIEYEQNWEDEIWGDEGLRNVDGKNMTCIPNKNAHEVYYRFLDVCKANGIEYTIGLELNEAEEKYRRELELHITE